MKFLKEAKGNNKYDRITVYFEYNGDEYADHDYTPDENESTESFINSVKETVNKELQKYNKEEPGDYKASLYGIIFDDWDDEEEYLETIYLNNPKLRYKVVRHSQWLWAVADMDTKMLVRKPEYINDPEAYKFAYAKDGKAYFFTTKNKEKAQAYADKLNSENK